MPRSLRLYLSDILQAITRIHALMEELDESQFKAGVPQTDGILFNLMTIGEAAKNIPQEFREQTPDINWSDIGRFRDFGVHHYFSLNMARVWDIVHTDLPELQQAVVSLLDAASEDDTDQPLR